VTRVKILKNSKKLWINTWRWL